MSVVTVDKTIKKQIKFMYLYRDRCVSVKMRRELFFFFLFILKITITIIIVIIIIIILHYLRWHLQNTRVNVRVEKNNILFN